MLDHESVILASIIPNRRDLLMRALNRLEPEHFRNEQRRNIFTFLGRYYDMTGDILPKETLSDIMVSRGVEQTKALLYEEVYAELSSLEVADHQFIWSLEALRDLRSKQLTGEAITSAFEVLERGLEVDGAELKGHKDARDFLYTELGHIDRLGSVETAPEGDIRLEAAEMQQEYAIRKANEGARGITTRIERLDRQTSGFQPGELILICAYTGAGKAQPLSEPVLTPSGWVPIGDLSEGSFVCDVDGGVSKVLQVQDWGVLPVYRLLFSDGTSTRASGNHLWTVQDNNDRHGKTRIGWRTLSTTDLAEGLRQGRRFYIPMSAPPVFEPKDLPVDPSV